MFERMNDATESVVNAAQEHGFSAALTIGGLFAAKRVLGPALDVVGTRLAGITEKGFENLGSIFERVPEAAGPWYPHPRTALKVLNDAAMYDDDVMQTYVAGMITGSRNSDGSDDRPVYYLSVLDRMTAMQTRFFHAAYTAVAQQNIDAQSVPFVAMDASEMEAHVAALTTEQPSYMAHGTSALLGIQSLGLVSELSVRESVKYPRHLSFLPTPLGMLLFDWVHGFGDDDYYAFPSRERPDLGMPPFEYSTASIGLPALE